MNLSQAKYSHLKIEEFEDLYKKEIKKELLTRETMLDLFDGGNEVTFHYAGRFSVEKIIRQIELILSNYKFPLISYNFAEIKGDLKLSYFSLLILKSF